MRYVVVYTDHNGDRVTHGTATDHGTACANARRLGVGMPQRFRETIGIQLVRKAK